MIKAIIVVALTVLLATFNVSAAKFGVRVVSEAGAPVPGVAVCIGTYGDYKQFGAHFTSKTGDVALDVPNVPLVVTISKSRFTGVRMAEPARSFNLIKEVKLIEGIPGPRCRADSSLVDNVPGHKLNIDNVEIENGVANIVLIPSVAGDPSHYRVSKDESFSDSSWKRYTASIKLNKRLADSPAVYLQLRKVTEVKNARLEARSAVISVSIPKL